MSTKTNTTSSTSLNSKKIAKYLLPTFFILLILLIITLIFPNNKDTIYTSRDDGKVKEIISLKIKIEDLEYKKAAAEKIRRTNSILTTDIDGTISGYRKYIMGDSIRDKIFFSFEYPKQWTRKGQVLWDRNNDVARFEYTAKDDSYSKCVLEEKFDISPGRERFISQKEVEHGRLTGIYTLSTVITEGYDKNGTPNTPGNIFPNLYCLENKNGYVNITFYEYSEIPQNQILYNKILNSIVIGHPLSVLQPE